MSCEREPLAFAFGGKEVMITFNSPKKRAVRFGAKWLGVVLMIGNASAYELSTHALLTYQAFKQSEFRVSSSLYSELGIDTYLSSGEAVLRKAPFGTYYYDVQGTDARQWVANTLDKNGDPFDYNRMVAVRSVDNSVEFEPERDNLRVAGWLLRGAIREDDYTPIVLTIGRVPITLHAPPNPLEDRFGGVDRPLSHFYDPVNNTGISLRGSPAPAWALGVAPSNMFADSMAEDTGRRNHFSVYDARESMYRALTGRNVDNVIVASDEAARRAYWATTFRALGDLAHMIQDMAQPQHTRNEKHSGLGNVLVEKTVSGHASVYEFYIDARAKQSRTFDVDIGSSQREVKIGAPRPLTTAGYATPRFNRYSDYFSTAQAVGVANGVGLADYSNRGFFTAGKNLLNYEYDLPSPRPSAHQTSTVSAVGWDGTMLPGDFKLTMYNGTVQDTVDPTGTAENVPLVSVSVWDQFLESRGRLSPTMNYINYDANARLLLPRAVAYTSGLIDYFFRGKLEISLPDEGVYGVIDHAVENQAGTSGFRKLKLKLRNTTPAIVPTAGSNQGQSMTQNMAGSLVAVVKYHENTCYTPDLTGEFGSQEARNGMGDAEFNAPPSGCRASEEKIVVSTRKENVTLNAGDSAMPMTFDFPTPVPVNALDVYLQVVYRGPLGTESDAVVVATKDISEPTHITLVNITNYLFCFNDVWRYKSEDGSLPSDIPTQYANALQARTYTVSRTAFGSHAGLVANAILTRPLVVVNDLAPGRFARFAILTETGAVYNDQIDGFYEPVPPPYKLQIPASNQLSVRGTDLPNDPYTQLQEWAPIDKVYNTRGYGVWYGYPKAGTGDCYIRPIPAPPANPMKPLPPEPRNAFVPTIQPVTINFN